MARQRNLARPGLSKAGDVILLWLKSACCCKFLGRPILISIGSATHSTAHALFVKGVMAAKVFLGCLAHDHGNNYIQTELVRLVRHLPRERCASLAEIGCVSDAGAGEKFIYM